MNSKQAWFQFSILDSAVRSFHGAPFWSHYMSSTEILVSLVDMFPPTTVFHSRSGDKHWFDTSCHCQSAEYDKIVANISLFIIIGSPKLHPNSRQDLVARIAGSIRHSPVSVSTTHTWIYIYIYKINTDIYIYIYIYCRRMSHQSPCSDYLN